MTAIGAFTRSGRAFAALAGLLAVLPACGPDQDARAEEAAAPFQVGSENVVRVQREEVIVGPTVSGEIGAAREATVRAEGAGQIVDVLVERGERVRKGQTLARVDRRTLDTARTSARTAVQSAEAAAEVARREAERTELLVSAGALSQRDLDNARREVTAAEARVADARAALSAADEALSATVVRAPFDGVVSRRAVGLGDVASVGTELFTIIDPDSMRFEASVPSSEVGAIAAGMPVRFTVRGYAQPFEGTIQRISPQADAATRQVPIDVSVPDDRGELVAGLFAEGRVVVDAATGPAVPADVVNGESGDTWVLRVADGTAERVPVATGLTDERTERVLITSGLAPGDLVLRGAARGLTPGSPVEIEARPVS